MLPNKLGRFEEYGGRFASKIHYPLNLHLMNQYFNVVYHITYIPYNLYTI